MQETTRSRPSTAVGFSWIDECPKETQENLFDKNLDRIVKDKGFIQALHPLIDKLLQASV